MGGYVVQVTLVFMLTFLYAHAKKPPGYVAPPKEFDPDPPKYEYGYRIEEDKVKHGKDEKRDGIYAQGRYYVENGTESMQKVKYFADDWGYHPVVEYSNTGPHSQSSATFVLGEEAIKLKNNQKSIPQDPSDPGKADNLSKTSTNHLDPNQVDQPHHSNLDPLVLDNQLLDPADQKPISIDQPPADKKEQINPLKQLLLFNEPQFVLQNDPHLQVLTTADKYPQNRALIIDGAPQPPSKQPIFYYVQTQNTEPLIHFEPSLPINNPPENVQHLEALPQPQALVQSNNEAVDTNGNTNLETAALIKTPSQIVHFKRPLSEFGTRLNPRKLSSKLIESTKNLVSGSDVLSINAAVSSHNDIESSTLHTLLNKYVSPALVSSTTQPSLLKEPIVVAESEITDSESKPVTEETDENRDYFSTTARSTLAKLSKASDQIFITPRPVSSKFLAPITAGIQLQHVDEQIFNEDTTSGTKEEKVSIQVQKTIPYYLGMYEYPLGYDVENENRNFTDAFEQKAVDDIELGKTLLYFPGQDFPKAESLVHVPSTESSLLEINSNHLKSFESAKESSFVENQLGLQEESQQYSLVSNTKSINLEVPTRPYPVPFYIEKSNNNVPLALPHINSIPYPVSSQAFLLQIPGLFSKQKYHNLVQNEYRPNNVQLFTPQIDKSRSISQFVSYAPQNNQYSLKHNNGRATPKLRKLNLLVFPRLHIPSSLPSITKNPHDLYRQDQTYRYSNAQLNNGYLPPESEGTATNNYSAKLPEKSTGLMPPKRQLHTESRKNRMAKAHFDDSSIRMEYGFMPPLIPSLEIDEQGRPIEKDDNKN